ncbi:MAG TPA: hypothetical protein PLU30_22940 [Verrucomicrobiae bacterium]|nr:hypothetical protein [Verrucomicrobiae bacterium]
MTMKKIGLYLTTLVLAPWVSPVHADPTFPSSLLDWTVITVGGSNYVDVETDNVDAQAYAAPMPNYYDLVGSIGSISNATAYTARDAANLMFRVRVDDQPVAGMSVYAVLLNTDGDDFVDYILQIDDANDLRVEIVQTSTDYGPSSSPTWGGVSQLQNVASNQVTVGAIGTWSQYVLANTALGGDGDYFVDIAISWSDFAAMTSLTGSDQFSVAFATSSQHINLNKDKPDGGWSDLLTVPEPSTWVCVLLPFAGLALRRRCRRA